MKESFRKRLLAHFQILGFDFTQLVLNGSQKLPVHAVGHVAESYIGTGGSAGFIHFHDQMGIPDPAAHQGSIEDDGFHKTVTGTTQGFVFIRFLDAAGRVSTAVDGNSGFIAVNKKAGDTGQKIFENAVKVTENINLHIGDAACRKGSCILWHIIGGDIEEGVHKFQHGFILGETINKIKGTVLTADDQISFDNIKALFYGKSPVHIFCIVGERSTDSMFFHVQSSIQR